MWAALTRIPWKHLIRAAPHIADGARLLYRQVRGENMETLHSIPPGTDPHPRIEALERALRDQASLSKSMADEVEELATSLRTLSSRLTAALWLGGLGFLVSLAALLKTFLSGS